MSSKESNQEEQRRIEQEEQRRIEREERSIKLEQRRNQIRIAQEKQRKIEQEEQRRIEREEQRRIVREQEERRRIEQEEQRRIEQEGRRIELEQKGYDELCSMLTSRETHDYFTLKRVVLDISLEITKNKIENLRTTGIKEKCTTKEFNNSEEIIDRMRLEIQIIYESALLNIDDTNILGFINIFMFQCSVMFSLHEGLIRDIYKEDLRTGIGGIDQNVLEYLSSINWKDYRIIKGFLMNDYHFKPLVYVLDTNKEYTIENIQDEPDKGIILVKYQKKYTSRNLIPDYLNRVCYVELVSKTDYADGICVTSIEYLYHDIVHAANFFYSCGSSSVVIDELKEFYKFIEQNTPIDEFRKIRAFIYFEIHEGFCFLSEGTKNYISIEKRNEYRRLFQVGDLFKLVPSSLNIEQAKEYFREGRKLYNKYFATWRHRDSEIKCEPTIEPVIKTTNHTPRKGTEKKKSRFWSLFSGGKLKQNSKKRRKHKRPKL